MSDLDGFKTSSKSWDEHNINPRDTDDIYPHEALAYLPTPEKSRPTVDLQHRLQNRTCIPRKKTITEEWLQENNPQELRLHVKPGSALMLKVDARAKVFEMHAMSKELRQAVESSIGSLETVRLKVDDFRERYHNKPTLSFDRKQTCVENLIEISRLYFELVQVSHSMCGLAKTAAEWAAELNESADNQLGDMVVEITSFLKRIKDFKQEIQDFDENVSKACVELEKHLPGPSQHILTTISRSIFGVWNGFFS